MLDIYSSNVTVAEQSPIPFNSTNVDKDVVLQDRGQLRYSSISAVYIR